MRPQPPPTACPRACSLLHPVPLLALPLPAESPIQPFWIDESDALLFYSLTKVACVVGFARGSGFLIHRLPSDHPTLVKWSAPCFVTIRRAR